jgi:hypothetical protein
MLGYTYRPGSLWVVVIAVDRKDGDANIEIRVFVIYGGEPDKGYEWINLQELERYRRESISLSLIGIT